MNGNYSLARRGSCSCGGNTHMTTPHSGADSSQLWSGGGTGATRGHLAHSVSSDRASWEGFLEEVPPIQAGF